MLANTSAGSEMFIVTWDAPREAAGGNKSLRARKYPQKMVKYLKNSDESAFISMNMWRCCRKKLTS